MSSQLLRDLGLYQLVSASQPPLEMSFVSTKMDDAQAVARDGGLRGMGAEEPPICRHLRECGGVEPRTPRTRPFTCRRRDEQAPVIRLLLRDLPGVFVGVCRLHSPQVLSSVAVFARKSARHIVCIVVGVCVRVCVCVCGVCGVCARVCMCARCTQSKWEDQPGHSSLLFKSLKRKGGGQCQTCPPTG